MQGRLAGNGLQGIGLQGNDSMSTLISANDWRQPGRGPGARAGRPSPAPVHAGPPGRAGVAISPPRSVAAIRDEPDNVVQRQPTAGRVPSRRAASVATQTMPRPTASPTRRLTSSSRASCCLFTKLLHSHHPVPRRARGTHRALPSDRGAATAKTAMTWLRAAPAIPPAWREALVQPYRPRRNPWTCAGLGAVEPFGRQAALQQLAHGRRAARHAPLEPPIVQRLQLLVR